GIQRPCRTVRGWLWDRLTACPVRATSPPEDDGPAHPEDLSFVEHYRPRAAQLSRYYAGLYPGAFLLKYLLGFMAIFLATFGSALSATFVANGNSSRSIVISSSGIVLGLAEIFVVAFILINTHQANRKFWHEKSIDYRFLAEMFRVLTYVTPLGC